MCDNKGTQTIFNLVTPSDEAYILFLYMNGYAYWNARKLESRADRNKVKTEDGHVVPRKKWAQKNKNGYADCGISEEGLTVYKNLLTKTVARRNNTVHMQLFQEVWENFSREHGVATYVSTGRKRKRIQKTPEDNDYYAPLRLVGVNGVTETSLFDEIFEGKKSIGVPITPDRNNVPTLPHMKYGAI